MYDVAIIGGGIVGLATAFRLQEARPGVRLVVLEKEGAVGLHQTGRNSGVLHAGVYYRPGSQKAALCRAGKAQMEAFCTAEALPYRRCGKLIVAVDGEEVPRLEALHARARANGAAAERLGPEGLREREPHAGGVAALWVPETGVTDFGAVARRLREKVEAAAGEVRTGAAVMRAQPQRAGWRIETASGVVEARVVVNCAGLWADRVARLFGEHPPVRLVPFRGEYVELREAARALCKGLIYPVPDPAFPFLGVHVTRLVDGRVEAGPSAALAFAREGYRFGTVRVRELMEVLGYRGFRRLAQKHWRMGLEELGRSLSRRAFVRAAQRLVPALTPGDVVPAPAGVRAQAVLPDGSLADDFVLMTSARAVHLVNAPSPAATAALAIGQHVARLARERLA
ncbi:MAG TPA: L-2-hydroxyglutarate oxidase [Rubricoccaceae bacterium]|nr:L-2-hydroxyglutarate oxidase [Rubricoccaceae bacterium]